MRLMVVNERIKVESIHPDSYCSRLFMAIIFVAN
jgi:hypothetical protein